MKWYSRTTGDVERELQTDIASGLSVANARERLIADGPNALPTRPSEPAWLIFLRQFKSPLIYVLFCAALLVYVIGDTHDAIIIGVVLIFNAAVGAVQEGRARNALDALRRLAETSATVLRDGRELIIPDQDVVDGDIVILKEGEKVPADLRIIESRNLRVDESSLTGESVRVHKHTEPIRREGMSLGDQTNMVFKGTVVVGGLGRGIAVATGSRTELGKIGAAIAGVDAEIPLAKDIRHLSRVIVIAVFVLSALLFLFGIGAGRPMREMFSTVVALAVSIIPEGLPLVMTIILATGVWRMARRNALVKKLQAVEALGQANIIAVDKTGTLTENELVVRRVFAGERLFMVDGTGYEPKGKIHIAGAGPARAVSYPALQLIGKLAAFTADAQVAFREEQALWQVSGDPTEAAMIAFAEKLGFAREELLRAQPLVEEEPFDYGTKYHAAAYRNGQGMLVVVAGAPETILARCSFAFLNTGVSPLGSEGRANAEDIFHQLSGEGLRVVGLAYRDIPSGKHPQLDDPRDLVFAGFLGMEDSLRPEVPGAVARARAAHVRLVMMTGDHRLAAVSIATQAGIWREGDAVVTGDELKDMNDAELGAVLRRTTVFARITPQDKMRIIEAYQREGDVVAMTGDGVNDAPSLVAANLGVAMGRIGTEVAKDAADIVLLDDDFGTIVAAIEEGRGMYATIKKAILYLFSTNLGELLAVVGAIVIGLPLPVLPAQILWLNLVTDPFMGAALAVEPKEEGLLTKTFRRPNRYLIQSSMVSRAVLMGGTMMVGTLLLFGYYSWNAPLRATTVALTALAVFQWLNAWNCRSDKASAFKGVFANRALVWALLGSAALHVFVVYTPFMQKILFTVPLAPIDWALAIGVSFSVVAVEELRKFVARHMAIPI
ncbi:MAG: hypothetical protein RL681_319 [Candidatus Parcubacteria bacterium]|jgi:Ca2+-transporting ATPase